MFVIIHFVIIQNCGVKFRVEVPGRVFLGSIGPSLMTILEPIPLVDMLKASIPLEFVEFVWEQKLTCKQRQHYFYIFWNLLTLQEECTRTMYRGSYSRLEIIIIHLEIKVGLHAYQRGCKKMLSPINPFMHASILHSLIHPSICLL